MKHVLERLMARQQKLLGRLDPPVTKRPRAPTLSAEEEGVRAKEEAQALSAAQERLLQGDIESAKVLLTPFASTAKNVRILTTLSQIASSEGDFDGSLELLRRAETLDPANHKVWWLLARACSMCGLHSEELHYRRRLAFVDPAAPAQNYVELVRAIHRATPKGTKLPVSEIRLASKKLLEAPGVDNATRVKFAEAMYVFEGMAREARSHYAAGAPAAPGEHDVSARWVRLFDWCTESGIEIRRLTDAGVPSHRPSFAELRDVHVFPHLQWTPVLDGGRVALSGFMIQRVRLRSEDPLSPLLMTRHSNAELRLPDAAPEVDAPALLIGGMNQYYHHTIEFLSSLAVAETLGVATDLPIVVNDDLGPFQLEQLALLGYDSTRLIRVRGDTPQRFRKLSVPTRLVRGGRWVDPMVPTWYRRRMVDSSSSHGADRKLYLSRAKTTRRRIINEDQVVRLLRQRGYEVVHPQALSVRQQIDLFSRASHIVGPAGGAMTNMIYAPPGTHVVTFFNGHVASGVGDLYFDALAEACGHRFTPIKATPVAVKDGERLVDADVRVDLELLRTLLD